MLVFQTQGVRVSINSSTQRDQNVLQHDSLTGLPVTVTAGAMYSLRMRIRLGHSEIVLCWALVGLEPCKGKIINSLILHCCGEMSYFRGASRKYDISPQQYRIRELRIHFLG